MDAPYSVYVRDGKECIVKMRFDDLDDAREFAAEQVAKYPEDDHYITVSLHLPRGIIEILR
jgi:hypothetical protein